VQKRIPFDVHLSGQAVYFVIVHDEAAVGRGEVAHVQKFIIFKGTGFL
jgi:hypothetical protein